MAAPCATQSPRYRLRTSYLVATVVATVVIGASAAAPGSPSGPGGMSTFLRV